jgi:hypothetical protein
MTGQAAIAVATAKLARGRETLAGHLKEKAAANATPKPSKRARVVGLPAAAAAAPPAAAVVAAVRLGQQ